MNLKRFFKGLRRHSRRDSHKKTGMVRVLVGDKKALKVVSKSHNITMIQAFHRIMIIGCSKIVWEDVIKHEERCELVKALCESADIKVPNLDKLTPNKESPDESPDSSSRGRRPRR